MAKGKKSSGKHYVSKGERDSVNRRWVKVARKEHINSVSRDISQLNAYLKLRNVVLTIPNPNKNETNKRFIKVNAREVWGNPKK